MKLLPYQQKHAERIRQSLIANGIAIDGSFCGSGKTYVAAHVCKSVGKKAFVICPKVAIPVWKKILDGFGVEIVGVVNYEKLRTGNTPWGKFEKRIFKWALPENTVIIGDEIHRAKGRDSLNARMLRDAKGIPMILLSATLADSPLDLRAIAHVAGLCDWHGWWGWLLRNGCSRGRFGLTFNPKRKDVLLNLHNELFVKRGGRLRIEDLGPGEFPETQIVAESFQFNNEIGRVYQEMEEELAVLAEATAHDKQNNPLTVQLRARQKIELLKAPGIVSMVNDFLEDGHSVVVFVNYRATMDALCERMKTKCSIYGGQDQEERERCIQEFQANRARVIVVNVQAGGAAVSLHDIHGTHPRVALICPTYSATELRQALGRVHRAGGSRSLQRILFAAGTVEERVCARVSAKLARLDLLVDGDLLPLPEIPLNESQPPMSDSSDQGLSEPQQPNMTPAPATNSAERPHSRHSPSSLPNKAKCCGWENDPDPNRDTSAADRGTLGHRMVEEEDLTLAPEDRVLTEAADKCLSFLRRFAKPGTAHHKELKLPILDQFGHLDHLFVHQDGSADLVDLKFAQNFYPASSAQFYAYMIGTWDRFPNVNEIRVWVLHPFIDAVDQETFTREKDYDRLVATVKAIIDRAENPNPDEFKIGKQCAWCGRLRSCKKWAEFGLEVANRYASDGEKFSLPAGSVHGSDIEDPATLAVLWRIAPLVQKAADGWRKAALEKRLEGTELPGLELTERKGKREITSATAAFEAVKDRVDPRTFIEACDIRIGALETIFAETAPRGEKGKAKGELMTRLLDASAVSSGAPVQMLRELK